MTGKIKRNARLLLRTGLARGAAVTLILLGVLLLFKALETLVLLVLDTLGISAAVWGTGGLYDILSTLPLASPANLAATCCVLLLASFVTAPLYIGIKGWFFRLSGGAPAPVGAVFEPFARARMLFKSWLLAADIFLRSFFWLYLFLLPGVLLGGTGFALLTARLAVPNAELLGTLAAVMGGLLSLLGLVLGVLAALRYTLGPYLLADDPAISVRRAIKLSVRYMRGYQTRMLGFYLSFVLWGLLCVLVLPLLYVFPYQQASLAIYARYLIAKGRMEDGQERAGQEDAKAEEDEQKPPAALPDTEG